MGNHWRCSHENVWFRWSPSLAAPRRLGWEGQSQRQTDGESYPQSPDKRGGLHGMIAQSPWQISLCWRRNGKDLVTGLVIRTEENAAICLKISIKGAIISCAGECERRADAAQNANHSIFDLLYCRCQCTAQCVGQLHCWMHMSGLGEVIYYRNMGFITI